MWSVLRWRFFWRFSVTFAFLIGDVILYFSSRVGWRAWSYLLSRLQKFYISLILFNGASNTSVHNVDTETFFFERNITTYIDSLFRKILHSHHWRAALRANCLILLSYIYKIISSSLLEYPFGPLLWTRKDLVLL